MSKRLDSMSLTIFNSPANHCEYRHMSALMTSVARWRAATSWAGLSNSQKLLFFSQPSAEVLSVWLRTQLSGLMRPARSSTQMVVVQPRNSKVLSVRLRSKPVGNWNCQAFPEDRL